MATRKQSKPTTPANVPVTGLGETIEQITTTCGELADTLLALVPGKRPPKLIEQILDAAYKYGIAERRRRKLARKVAGAKDEE